MPIMSFKSKCATKHRAGGRYNTMDKRTYYGEHVRKPGDTVDLDSCRIGIDAGSKTIKLVVIDERGSLGAYIYRRHKSDLRETLHAVLKDFIWHYGDFRGPVAITGSAGIAIAKALGIPFVQEVLATTHAVRNLHPEADCIIELGGEDAKIMYLTGGTEQRMNATCAGGTGGFIETMAHMVGVRTKDIDWLALKASRIYPIASRCAVFAQTDVRPLLNAGARREDIAASALEAVVQQTIGGLACGRPIRGTVVFLGGPLEKIGSLASRFRKALGLSPSECIKPTNAHLYTARGAAMLAAEDDASAGQGPVVRSLSELDKALLAAPPFEDDLAHLPPLFRDDRERACFDERHRNVGVERASLEDAETPLFLGIDAGSTTVKYALIDAKGRLVESDYRPVGGKLLETSREMLIELRRKLAPKPFVVARDLPIARAVVTGYGEDLLKNAFRLDAGVVETRAHLRAAEHFEPEVSFILDMGGQDIKALWVHNGTLEDVVLNEACSSGCGSFVEGAARSLQLSEQLFSDEALRAKSPLDLGTKCTVFMTSRIRHAQKIGVPKADIAAGAAYSVVRNAIERVIGRNIAGSMGDVVVVQGGAFKSDAVLRAFELLTGKEAARPREAHLMGAYGCALIALEQWEDAIGAERADGMVRSDELERADGILSDNCRSTLLSIEELEALAPRTRTERCAGCANRCVVAVVELGDRFSLSGNRCERAWDFVGAAIGREPAGEKPPNAIRIQRRDLRRFGDVDSLHPRGLVRIGILNTLNTAIDLAFWHTLMRELGFSLLVSPFGEMPDGPRKGAESIPSESVCQPAKLSHAAVYELLERGVDAVFAPTFERGRHCPVARGYNEALAAHTPPELTGSARFLMPHITSLSVTKIPENETDKKRLFDCFAELAAPYAELGIDELDAALERGLAALTDTKKRAQEANERALSWVHADPARRGIVLDGRAYHYDPAVLHHIDETLTALGVAVLSSRDLPDGGAVASSCSTVVQQRRNSLWSQSKHLMRTMDRVFADPQLEIVSLRSFGCGYDAVSFDEAREYAYSLGRPFTELKVDEMVDVSHIRIRLRTLIELLERGQGTRGKGSGGCIGEENPVALPAEKPPLPGEQELSPPHLPFDPLGPDDLSLARARATNDLCFTAQALAAHAALACDESSEAPLEVPYVCHGCLIDALPYELRRIRGRIPSITWTDATALAKTSREHALSPENGNGRISVGLVGNPLLVFDDFMNEGIVHLLGELGCDVVYPEPRELLVDDVRYEAALDGFAARGVDCVIYLQSFGCLKGHVRSRGAARWFKKRYPDMPVTVIDYDPESSALNRENRIRLAVASRKQSPSPSAL